MLFKIRILTLLVIFAFGYQCNLSAIAETASVDDDCSKLIEADGILVKLKSTNSKEFRTNGSLGSSIDTATMKPLFSESFEKSFNTRTIKSKTPTKYEKKKELIQTLMAKNGLDRVFVYKPINNSCAELKATLKELNSNPNVEYAEPNLKVKVKATARDYFYRTKSSWGQSYDDLWGLKKIQADRAWDYSQGEGVVVAVVDSGIDYNHPDLWDNIWVNPGVVSDRNQDGKINLDDLDLNANKFIEPGEVVNDAFGYDFINNDIDPMDDYGHGTHISGIIAAVKDNNIGIAGVAPKAKILPVKALDDGGSGTIASLSISVIYASIYADISNNSWGIEGLIEQETSDGSTIKDAFDTAAQVGMISFVAAGNEKKDAILSYPARYSNVITVSSSAFNDEKSSFSNYGSVVDIAAPGGGNDGKDESSSRRNILSTLPESSTIGRGDGAFKIKDLTISTRPELNSYYRLAGTSMSTPFAAGVAALIKSKHPEYEFDDIRNIITQKSDRVLTGRFYYGAGRLNALKSVTAVTPPAFLEFINISNLFAENIIKGISNFEVTVIKSKFGKEIASTKFEYSYDQRTWTAIPIVDLFGKKIAIFNSLLSIDSDVYFRLTAKATDGETFTLVKKYIIDNQIGIEAPKADFTIPTQEADSNTNIVLDASSSTGFGIVSYGWDYNSDGIIDKATLLPKLTTKFGAGLYNITLKVTNLKGQTSTISKFLNVFPAQSTTSTIRFIDDGMSGFSIFQGAWSNTERFVAKDSIGYDMKFASKRLANEELKIVSWTFTGLQPGVYEVYTTWSQGTVSGRATNAPFTFGSGSASVAGNYSTLRINQQLAPNGIIYLNRPWQLLGRVTVRDGSLGVALSNDANDYVFADAVMVKKVTN